MSFESNGDTQLPGNNLFLISLISGGIAGLLVDVILYPIDTIKTRLQSDKSFWRAGGFWNIYTGLAPVAAGSVPSAALFFCTYESLKSFLSPYAHKHIVHMLSAAVGEVVACLIRVPVEIAKKRRQVRSKQYEGVGATDILIQAYRTEGIFDGLYRGFGATVLREIPFAFIQFPLWEYLKLHWTSAMGLPLNFVSVAICGAISGGIAAGVTTPLDVAKTRIMLDTRNGEKYRGIYQILRTVYRDEGIRGLFAGFIPRIMWITIGGAIFFGGYDLSTNILTVTSVAE